MAFFQERTPGQPFLRAPPAVIWLIVVLVAVYVAVHVALPETRWNEIAFQYGFVPARYSPGFLAAYRANPGSLIDRALPFVCYIFLHANVTHLLINSVWLLAFGPIVARRFGTVLFLVFFLVCGILGAAAHLACNWGSPAPVIGASAAVSGLMAAGFRMLPLEAGGEARPLAPLLSRRILVWSALWVVVNVAAGVTGLGTQPGLRLVAWQAHLGGYAAGLVLAGVFDALAQRAMRRSGPRA